MNEFERFGKTDKEPHALDWDSEISQDAVEIPLLVPGIYPFTVDHFERKQYDGGEKIPACPLAEVYLNVHTKQGDVPVRTALFLHQTMEWQLSAFFRCVSLKKKGEALRMNWNKVPGATGWAEFSNREYKDKKYNQVRRFIDPGKAPQAASAPQPVANTGFTAGQF